MPATRYRNDDLHRITLPAGEWVEVKRRLGKDDEREIVKRTLRGQRIAPGQSLSTFDVGAVVDGAGFALLEVVIKRWHICDQDGEPLELTDENLRALDDETVNAIKASLDELYPSPRSDDDRKNSSTTSPSPSLVAAESLPSSVGSP